MAIISHKSISLSHIINNLQIRNELRLLARELIDVQKTHNTINELKDLMQPKFVNTILNIINILANLTIHQKNSTI